MLATQTGLGGRIERECLEVLDVREPSRLTIKRRSGCKVPPPTSRSAVDDDHHGQAVGRRDVDAHHHVRPVDAADDDVHRDLGTTPSP